jgi:hypothetical protein
MYKKSYTATKENHEGPLRKEENTTEIRKGVCQNKTLNRYHANNQLTLTT